MLYKYTAGLKVGWMTQIIRVTCMGHKDLWIKQGCMIKALHEAYEYIAVFDCSIREY